MRKVFAVLATVMVLAVVLQFLLAASLALVLDDDRDGGVWLLPDDAADGGPDLDEISD